MTISPNKTSGTSTETTALQENSAPLPRIAACIPFIPPAHLPTLSMCALTLSSVTSLLFLWGIGVHFLSSSSSYLSNPTLGTEVE